MSDRNKRVLQKCVGDQRGNVGLIFGCMMLPLMMVIGGAVDYARAVAVSTEQQSAIDAAVLAGSVAAGPDTNRSSVATAVFTANYQPERYAAPMPTPTVTS